jgi:hypothetical protein
VTGHRWWRRAWGGCRRGRSPWARGPARGSWLGIGCVAVGAGPDVVATQRWPAPPGTVGHHRAGELQRRARLARRPGGLLVQGGDPHLIAEFTEELPTHARPAGPQESIGRLRARAPSSTGHRTHSHPGRLRAEVPTWAAVRRRVPGNTGRRAPRSARHQLPAGEGHPTGAGAARSPGTPQDRLGQRDHLDLGQPHSGRAQAVDRPGAIRLVDENQKTSSGWQSGMSITGQTMGDRPVAGVHKVGRHPPDGLHR